MLYILMITSIELHMTSIPVLITLTWCQGPKGVKTNQNTQEVQMNEGMEKVKLQVVFYRLFSLATLLSVAQLSGLTLWLSVIEWFFLSFDLLTGDCTAQKYHKVWLILRTLNSGIRRSLSFSIDYFVFLSELQKSTKIRSRVVSQSAVLAIIRWKYSWKTTTTATGGQDGSGTGERRIKCFSFVESTKRKENNHVSFAPL